MTTKKLKLLEKKLVLAMAKNVPFDGWCWEALYRGAQDINLYDDEINEENKKGLRELFNNDLVQIIKIFNKYFDDEMERKFLKIKPSIKKVSEKIKTLIMLRLNSAIEYKDSIRFLVGFMALPQNSKESLLMLYKTCDRIWRVSGDKSTDFSFYTKRLILSAVYTSTIMYWLSNESRKLEHTESFLDRRLSDVYKLGKLKEKKNILKNNLIYPSRIPIKILNNFSKNFRNEKFTTFINKFKNL